MYPKVYKRLYRHWLYRGMFFLFGVLLLYAPFALLTRLLLVLFNQPYTADVHRVCLRMPIQWLSQPWMFGTMLENPLYLISVLILPLLALFLGPLFCGWMCPAGGITEFLSRLVPPRFQINMSGKINPAPVRYGFLVGMMGIAFIGGNACCSFCNFTHTQNLISAISGDLLGISYWASFSIVSFILWFFVLGLFTRGGRGWCNFLCPAGALMGLTHAIGKKLRISKFVMVNADQCNGCKLCEGSCPALAISTQAKDININAHTCNICMDCSKVCPHQAIAYKRV